MKGAKLSRKSKRSRSFKSSNSSSLNKSELKKRRTTEQRSVKRKRSQSSNESVQEGVQEGVQENTTIISLKLKKGNNISPVLNNLQIIYDFYIESILDYTYYLDIAYYNAIREVNEDIEVNKDIEFVEQKKIMTGGKCDDNCKIDFKSYNIFKNTDIEAAVKAADTEFRNSIIADNHKDFIDRSGSISLTECFTAGIEARDYQKIPMDKGARYNKLKEKLLSDFNSMVIQGDNLTEMLEKGQQIAMNKDTFSFVDTQPNGLKAIIDTSTIYTSFIDAFDSASAKLTDINKQPKGSEIELANSGLKFLKSRYVDLDEYFEDIEIIEYYIINKIPNFKFKFTFKQGTSSSNVIEIPTGPTGELSVPRITRTIICNNKLTDYNNKLTDCNNKLTDFGEKLFKMINTNLPPYLNENDHHKIFNTLLIYFKCAGDFLKIWFGFNYNKSNENNNQNLLATCDISLFNIAMLFNMNLKEFNTLSNNNINKDLFKKHCWMVLGTGSASNGVDSGKKIVFANNDEFFINKSLKTLINYKLGAGNYHFVIHDNDTDNKIKIYLLANETSILQKEGNISNYFKLLVYSFDKPGIWDDVINESDKENLKKCKEEYSKIIKHVETFYCLSNLSLTKKLVEQIINNIKTKLKYIRNFQLLQRLWPERLNYDKKYKAIKKFLDSAMPYFEKLSNMFNDRIPLITEMEIFISSIDSLSKESKESKESVVLYKNIQQNLKVLEKFIKETLYKDSNNELIKIFNTWYDNIQTLLSDEYFNDNEKDYYYNYIKNQLEKLETCRNIIKKYSKNKTGGNKKKNIRNKDTSYKLSKYKKRVDEYKNKVLSKYFINKIKKHINDDNICIYKIGINKFKTIIKDIYKI